MTTPSERTFTASITIDGELFTCTRSTFIPWGADALGFADYTRRAVLMELIQHLIDNGKISKLIDVEDSQR